MLLLVTVVKLLTEIALLALAGQWVLGILAGAKRDANVFYRLFEVLTKPVRGFVRMVTPKAVIDRHIPIAAFVALLSVWFVATFAKINVCMQVGMEQCR
jgi:hypothetical protein